MPALGCVLFEFVVLFLWVNRHLSGLTIALNRLELLASSLTPFCRSVSPYMLLIFKAVFSSWFWQCCNIFSSGFSPYWPKNAKISPRQHSYSCYKAKPDAIKRILNLHWVRKDDNGIMSYRTANFPKLPVLPHISEERHITLMEHMCSSSKKLVFRVRSQNLITGM